MDFEKFIQEKEPNAKGLQTKNNPNWDLEFLFKIWRKNHAIKLNNHEYETLQANINDEYPWLKEYHKKIQESHAKITKWYADKIKEYNKYMSKTTDKFVTDIIDTYFDNLK